MSRRASNRLLLAVVVGVALAVSSVTTPLAQNQASTAQISASTADIPRVPFEKYTLPNGLEVILSQNQRLPMVAVNLWYHVGPANEEPGRTGFAHLFEHMMFQSSKHVPEDSHIQLLEAAGASNLNGTTDFDRTNYFETVPANQLELALWLESDRMGYLLEKVDQPALSNQQDVVRNERRQSVENRPYGLAQEALVQSLFPKWHPYYGNVIGSHEDIQAVNLDDVNRFFRQYYAPNNASLAIVGDIDVGRTKTLVEKYFGTLKRGPAVPPVEAETPRITSERRRVVYARVELPRVSMAWLSPPIFEPGDADADIAASVLGAGRSSRLYKKLVYEDQIAQDVSVRQESLMLGSIFQIQATARPGHTAEELEKAIDAELAALKMRAPALRARCRKSLGSRTSKSAASRPMSCDGLMRTRSMIRNPRRFSGGRPASSSLIRAMLRASRSWSSRKMAFRSCPAICIGGGYPRTCGRSASSCDFGYRVENARIRLAPRCTAGASGAVRRIPPSPYQASSSFTAGNNSGRAVEAIT